MANLRPKTCIRPQCGKTYQPSGPAQKLCPDCWKYKTCECGTEFEVTSQDRRTAHCCPDCRVKKRTAHKKAEGEAKRAATTFTCRKCKRENLPVSESVKDASRPGGIMERCKECERKRSEEHREAYPEKQREAVRQAMANRRLNDPEFVQEQARKIRESRWAAYGATPEMYAAAFEEQGGRCDICGSDKPNRGRRDRDDDEFFSFDHDHATNQPRGLLCVPCNSMLGNVNDDPERLAQGIAYLARWGITGPRYDLEA